MNGIADPTAEFWTKQAAAYTAADGQWRYYHSEFAAILNAALDRWCELVGPVVHLRPA